MGDVALYLIAFLVIPALLQVPYLRANSRFYRLVGGRPRTMRDRFVIQSKAELGDFGGEASSALRAMRRLQVLGIIAAGLWLAAFYGVSQNW